MTRVMAAAVSYLSDVKNMYQMAVLMAATAATAAAFIYKPMKTNTLIDYQFERFHKASAAQMVKAVT